MVAYCPFFPLVHSVEPAVQENGDDAGEGRDAKEADPGSPRRCDIITISGRKEKCEAAKEALEVRVRPPSPRGPQQAPWRERHGLKGGCPRWWVGGLDT